MGFEYQPLTSSHDVQPVRGYGRKSIHAFLIAVLLMALFINLFPVDLPLPPIIGNCPIAPKVNITETREKLSTILWNDIEPKTKILLVSAPRYGRPESGNLSH
jgi:hypothetical protein